MPIVFSISDEEISKMAKEAKQRDIERAKQIRENFSDQNFPSASTVIKILGIEESKPLEEYEKEIREQLPRLFPQFFPDDDDE